MNKTKYKYLTLLKSVNTEIKHGIHELFSYPVLLSVGDLIYQKYQFYTSSLYVAYTTMCFSYYYFFVIIILVITFYLIYIILLIQKYFNHYSNKIIYQRMTYKLL